MEAEPSWTLQKTLRLEPSLRGNLGKRSSWRRWEAYPLEAEPSWTPEENPGGRASVDISQSFALRGGAFVDALHERRTFRGLGKFSWCQLGANLKSTWGQLGGQNGPTWDQLGAHLVHRGQLGINLGPTWRQLRTNLSQLGTTWVNLGST